MLFRAVVGIRFKAALKPATAELYQGAHRRCIILALVQIAFPVVGHFALTYLGGRK